MTRRDNRGSATPLLDWGEQLRAGKHKRRILGRRVAVAGIGVTLLGLTMAFPPAPRLVWNASASAPIGLYAVSGRQDIASGDMVLVRVPDRWRRLAAERRYIPINIPLVKRVAAAPGDRVCARGREIYVNGHPVAERREADGRDRPMPWWNGCVMLRSGALFLLMDSPDSFDGRYFGPTSRGDVIGEARLLWLG